MMVPLLPNLDAIVFILETEVSVRMCALLKDKSQRQLRSGTETTADFNECDFFKKKSFDRINI